MDLRSKPPGRLKSALIGALGGWSGRAGIKLTDGGFWSSHFGASNFTKQPVTVDGTLQLSTAWACVRLISETMGTLPVNAYVERKGVREIAPDHQIHYLLHTQPNAEMTAAAFWQAFLASMLLWGFACVEKRFSAAGSAVIVALDFLSPDRVTRSDGRWFYVDEDGLRREIADRAMWHTPAFTLDGINGLSPVRMGANVFGGAMAADKASADTFTNGMKASGLVTVDAVLKSEQRQQIREHVKTVASGGGFFVLEKGSGFQQLNMNPQDAELLTTRAFNVEEICRWFRVPPFMVGHAEKSTSWGTGIEQQMIGFVTFVLRPWAVRIEQSIRMHLFSPTERRKYSAQFVLEGLMRGDSASRAAYYSIMTQNGIYTRDFCRALENLPQLGGNAAVLTVQANLVPLDKLGEKPPTAPPGDPATPPADPAADPSKAALEGILRTWLKLDDNSAA